MLTSLIWILQVYEKRAAENTASEQPSEPKEEKKD